MFGFNQVKRQDYNSTFLRKVIINIGFPVTSLLKEKVEEIRSIFSNDFPRIALGKNKGVEITIGGKEVQPSFKTTNEGDNISLKTKDGGVELLINSDSISFSIEGRDYKSFEDSIQNILDKILLLFNKLSIEEITKCSLRKINLIEFNYNDKSPNGVLNILLNKSIIYNDDAFTGMDYITQNIHNLEFKDNEYTLNIKYGMNILPIPDMKIGQVIVDNTITLASSIQADKINKEIFLLNEELFNVFDWMFNDNAKNILKNGTN